MKSTLSKCTIAALLMGNLFSVAHAGGRGVEDMYQNELAAYQAQGQSKSMRISASVEVGFNPEDSSQSLMIKPIDSAKSTIHILAGEFSNSKVNNALQEAMKRGVKVSIIVDAGASKGGATREALANLANAGATVLVSSVQPALNERAIIADGDTVAIGSFSFASTSVMPNKRPVESISLFTNASDLAAAHLQHWNTLVSGVTGNKTTPFTK